MARAFAVTRLIVLYILTLTSAISLFLAAYLRVDQSTHVTTPYYAVEGESILASNGIASTSNAGSTLAIAISVLTLLIAVPSLAIRLFTTSAWKKFLTLAWLELCWSVLLAILWFATSLFVTISSVTAATTTDGPFAYMDSSCLGACGAERALTFFVWVDCFFVSAYVIALSGHIAVHGPKGQGTFSMIVDDIVSPKVDIPHGADPGYTESGMPPYPMGNMGFPELHSPTAPALGYSATQVQAPFSPGLQPHSPTAPALGYPGTQVPAPFSPDPQHHSPTASGLGYTGTEVRAPPPSMVPAMSHTGISEISGQMSPVRVDKEVPGLPTDAA